MSWVQNDGYMKARGQDSWAERASAAAAPGLSGASDFIP